MTWTLGEAEVNAAAIVKDFIDTCYTQPGFNVKVLTNLIAEAIRQAEEEAARATGRTGAIRRAEEAARAAGRVEGMEHAAEFIAGFASVEENENHTREVARALEQGIRASSRELEQRVRALLS
jgi:hypothetical protein